MPTEIAESQRFNQRSAMSANLPSDFCCAPLGGDFDMRRYARVTSAIYEAAPGMRLVPLYKEGGLRAGWASHSWAFR